MVVHEVIRTALEPLELSAIGGNPPAFENRAGAIFRSPWHRLGGSSHPLYEMRGTQIFRTAWHPNGPSTYPLFELRGQLIFPTVWNQGST
jgi:hypothetical protein